MPQYRVHGNLMCTKMQDVKPEQPKAYDRLFLKRAPIRAMHYVERQVTPDFTFSFVQLPMQKVCPRKVLSDINFEHLQVWLNHLGEALYNPVTAFFCDGKYYYGDGDHRTRCLWEIGEPTINVNLAEVTDRENSEMHRSFLKWLKRKAKVNWKPRRHSSKFNLYPSLNPLPKTLLNFYGSRHDVGDRFKKNVDRDVSFQEIIDEERCRIFQHIANRAALYRKTVFDVGASYGYYSYLCVEFGASPVYAIEAERKKTTVIAEIIRRRNYLKRRLIPQTGYVHDFLIQKPALKPDVVLLLNVFHHLLRQNHAEAWAMFNKFLSLKSRIYVMMGAMWNVLGEHGRDVAAAIKANSKVPVTVTPLYRSSYRNRVLYEVTA